MRVFPIIMTIYMIKSGEELIVRERLNFMQAGASMWLRRISPYARLIN
jgi:hypothetical protein